MSATEHLFAYGTLQSGHAPDEVAHLMQNLRAVGAGIMYGTLYDLGSYPGAVIDPTGTQRIKGTVFKLPSDRSLLAKLDDYEDYRPHSLETSLFRREVHPVHLADGRTLPCWVYIYNRHPGNAAILDSGVYSPR